MLICLFSDFLIAQGDFDVKISEWAELAEENRVRPEDISQTVYTYHRGGDFLHPRTSMLMFGPKNALNTQNHFLYVVDNKGKHVNGDITKWFEKGSGLAPVKFMLITISQFDSIPMADVFKLVQYWSFELSPSNETIVRVGMHVHFVKFTILKSNIILGCQQELTDMSKAWVRYAKSRLNNLGNNIQRTNNQIANGNQSGNSSSLPAGSTTNTSLQATARQEASIAIANYDFYFNVVCGLLIGILILMLLLLIQQYRSHYILMNQINKIAKDVDINQLFSKWKELQQIPSNKEIS